MNREEKLKAQRAFWDGNINSIRILGADHAGLFPPLRPRHAPDPHLQLLPKLGKCPGFNCQVCAFYEARYRRRAAYLRQAVPPRSVARPLDGPSSILGAWRYCAK